MLTPATLFQLDLWFLYELLKKLQDSATRIGNESILTRPIGDAFLATNYYVTVAFNKIKYLKGDLNMDNG